MRHRQWFTWGLLALGWSTIGLATEENYLLRVETTAPAKRDQVVTLPDVSGYTGAAIQARLASWQGRPGVASESRMSADALTRKFFMGGRLSEWARKQQRFPQVLMIDHGLVTLSTLARQFPDAVVDQGDGVYLARLPIVVGAKAALLVDQGNTLRLSEDRGAFLVNAGECFIMQAHLLGWREKTNGPATFSGDKHAFRPFYTAWSGSQTYMFGSEIAHLGSATTKAYGLSLSTFSASDVVYAPKGLKLEQRPTGWLIENRFHDMFYGFYSFEADDVVILRNVYTDNYYYGIDPHDRSRRLIIAENRVSGTKVRHGIIGSREVDDSFIFRNVSFNNHLAGIMLDRLSNRNVVAQNITHDNGSDGIAMYESHNNLIWANQVYRNAHHGIRFRNSRNTAIVDNVIVNNARYGVYGHIKDLSYQGYRDLTLDPYEQHASASLRGGVIGMNQSGAIFVEHTDYVRLQGIRLERNGGGSQPLSGALTPWNGRILPQLHDPRQEIELSVSAPGGEATVATTAPTCGGVACGG